MAGPAGTDGAQGAGVTGPSSSVTGGLSSAQADTLKGHSGSLEGESREETGDVPLPAWTCPAPVCVYMLGRVVKTKRGLGTAIGGACTEGTRNKPLPYPKRSCCLSKRKREVGKGQQTATPTSGLGSPCH